MRSQSSIPLHLLVKIFEQYGEIESLVILKSKDSTRHQGLFVHTLACSFYFTGCGFVRFASITDAARAIHELNGKHVIDSVCSYHLDIPYPISVDNWTDQCGVRSR